MEAVLIEKFFNKQCTPLEAKQVVMYLKAHPSVLENYVSKDEWNTVAIDESFPEEEWYELWQRIRQKNKTKLISIRLKRFAVAAAVFLAIGISIYYLIPVKQPAQPLAQTQSLQFFQKQMVLNTTNRVRKIILEDSSVVMLAPASYINYTIPFQNNKREILLEGEAEFHVAKNKHKPFIVYAGALATTALGTVFSVKKNTIKNNITVKLFRGKVVIQSIDKNLKGWKNDVFLLPGDQLRFNVYSASVTVQKNSSNTNAGVFVKNKIKQAATDSLKDQLVFNNTLLPQVLNKLSLFYNVKIKYDSLLVDTMNFTGTVTKNDALPVILKAIGNMNELNISQDENEFIISKQQ